MKFLVCCHTVVAFGKYFYCPKAPPGFQLHHDLFCSEIDRNVSKEVSRDMKTYGERSAVGKCTRSVDGKRVWRHLQQTMKTCFS